MQIARRHKSAPNSSSLSADVIVIGAGAAGVTAALELHKAGLRVIIVEGRDRIGGRICTVIDPVHRYPVELGAEFIHGRPPDIFGPLKKRNIYIHEVEGDTWCADDGSLHECDFFPEVDAILEKMDARKPDQSFSDFLKKYSTTKKSAARKKAERWATGYVTGFNAADPTLVGVHWLVQGMRAEEEIEGGRAFRSKHGYSDLISIFEEQLRKAKIPMHKEATVKSVQWKKGQVEVSVATSTGRQKLIARGALITVPLGVLQAPANASAAIRFEPKLPGEKRKAIHDIEMGKVIRITLRFRERFWSDLPKPRQVGMKSLSGLSFLLSHDKWFPTWWTGMPIKAPFFVGWAPFRAAERLSGKSQSFVVRQSLGSLSNILRISVRNLERLLDHAYLHDWQMDPFSRGAYSYGKVGGEDAPRLLGNPIDGTLFFAGEATDVSGYTGTVHGAIASGRRAAEEITKNLRPNSWNRSAPRE